MTDDTLRRRVGINKTNPRYDLDVAGTMASAEVISSHGVISTLTSDFANISYLDANLALASNVVSSNIVAINTATTSLSAYDILGSNVMAVEDLGMYNVSLTDECPFTRTVFDEILGYDIQRAGAIDASWVKMDSITSLIENLTGLFGSLAEAYAAFRLLKALFSPTPEVPQIPDALAQALEDALNGLGDSNSSNNIKIPIGWSNVTGKPIASYGSSKVGINGNLLFSGNLNYASNSAFMTDQWGNQTFISGSATQGTTIIDSNLNINANNITASNIFCNYYNALDSNGSIVFNNTNLQHIFNDPVTRSNTALQMSSSNIRFLTYNPTTSLYTTQLGIGNDGVVKVDGEIVCDLYKSSLNDGALKFWSWATELEYTNTFNSSNSSLWNVGQLQMTDAYLKYRTMRGSNAFQDTFSVNSNGAMNVGSNLTLSSKGELYVSSNLSMSNAVCLVANGGTSNENTSSALLTMDTSGIKYIWRTSYLDYFPVTGQWLTSKADTLAFNLDSNGIKMGTDAHIQSRMETFPVQNPVNPTSNITYSNIPRLQFSLSNGFTWGYGASQNGVNDIFNVSRLGEISVQDSTSLLTDTFFTSNNSLVRGKTTIDKTGQIWFSQGGFGKVLLDSNGTITRSNLTINSNGALAFGSGSLSNGVITLGSNMILQDAQMYMGSNFTLSNDAMSVIVDNSITLCNLTVSKQGALNVGAFGLAPTGEVVYEGSNTVITFGGRLPALDAFSNSISTMVNGFSSNFTTSNLNCINLTTVNATESNLFLQNLIMPETSTVSLGSNLKLKDGELWMNSNLNMSNVALNINIDTSGVTLCNLHISKQGAISLGECLIYPSGEISVGGTTVVNFNGQLPALTAYSNYVGSYLSAFSNSMSNGESQGSSFNLGNAILSGIVSAGVSTALQVGGKNLIDTFGNPMPDLINALQNAFTNVSASESMSAPLIEAGMEMSAPLISATTSFSAPTISATSSIYTPLLQAGTGTVIIDGMSNFVLIRKSASNGSNALLYTSSNIVMSNTELPISYYTSNSQVEVARFSSSGFYATTMYQNGISLDTLYASSNALSNYATTTALTALSNFTSQGLTIGNLSIKTDGSIFSGCNLILDATNNKVLENCIDWGRGDYIQAPSVVTAPPDFYTGTPLDW